MVHEGSQPSHRFYFFRPGPLHSQFFRTGPDRPGPAHDIIDFSDPALPIIFLILRAHDILEFSDPAQPGPAHDIPSEARETQALHGPTHHLCGVARGL